MPSGFHATRVAKFKAKDEVKVWYDDDGLRLQGDKYSRLLKAVETSKI